MKILIATDGSTCSRLALDEAMRVLALRDAEVFVIGVADLAAQTTGYEGVGGAIQLIADHELATATRNVEVAVGVLAANQIAATPIVSEGSPSECILDAARAKGVDMIVMGSHGGNAFERLVLGSVSEAVLHHHAGAVMIVRAGKVA